MENETLRVELPNGDFLVCEKYMQGYSEGCVPTPELITYVERVDGTMQDIAIVRGGTSKDIDVFVYADETQEDYTNEFGIDIFTEY